MPLPCLLMVGRGLPDCIKVCEEEFLSHGKGSASFLHGCAVSRQKVPRTSATARPGRRALSLGDPTGGCGATSDGGLGEGVGTEVAGPLPVSCSKGSKPA